MMNSKIIVLLCLALLSAPLLVVGDDFNCPLLEARTSNVVKVTDLRPTDIKVIMAMGDSITSAFGLQNSWNESRGSSFSAGGDAGAVTLPNFFKRYNPIVAGYSVAYSAVEVCYGDSCPPTSYYPETDGNNGAKSGAMMYDMVSTQVNYLIREVNRKPNMDVTSDWKVLTIMIGANDLCASCTLNLTYLTPDDYESNLMGTLERIRYALPRTFVNLVAGYNLSQAYDLSLRTPQCSNISRPLFIQCDCLFKPSAGPVRETIDKLITQFNDRAAKVATYYQRRAYDNFAVVMQPFLAETHVSDLPSSFLSTLDCFHPSKSGQEAMAIALWNSMLTPGANKQKYLNMSDTPICPNADTLLYTF